MSLALAAAVCSVARLACWAGVGRTLLSISAVGQSGIARFVQLVAGDPGARRYIDVFRLSRGASENFGGPSQKTRVHKW